MKDVSPKEIHNISPKIKNSKLSTEEKDKAVNRKGRHLSIEIATENNNFLSYPMCSVSAV